MSRIEENGKGLEQNLLEAGLNAKCIKAFENSMGETYLFNLESISQYNKKHIQKIVEMLSVFYHLNIRLIDSDEAHFGLFIKYPRKSLSLTQCINEVDLREIVIGKDILGKLVMVDFEKTPHLLIAGATGSGKSVLLKNLIANLLVYYGKNNNRFKKVMIAIIDTKNSDLKQFANISSNIDFINEVDNAITSINTIVEEMENRYKVGNYDYDIYLGIDELADLK